MLEDGSLLEVALTGGNEQGTGKPQVRYTVTDAGGTTLAEGTDLYLSPLAPDDTEGAEREALASLLDFIGHDKERYEMSDRGSWGKRYPAGADELNEGELLMGVALAAWADAHAMDLDMLKIELED